MKICKQCHECMAREICSSKVTPINKVCSNFLEAVDALKTARNRQITPLCDDYLPDDKCGRWGGLCNGRHCYLWSHKTARSAPQKVSGAPGNIAQQDAVPPLPQADGSGPKFMDLTNASVFPRGMLG